MQPQINSTTASAAWDTGEVSERLKEQHWKCCWRLKPPRGFESRPLRYFLANPSCVSTSSTNGNDTFLTGKVAIVTGSSRGIGRAIASKLAQAGAVIMFTGRDVPLL